MEDVRWLGFDWGERLYYASDYFEQLYDWAVQLIKAGKAYVCDLTADEIREYRGTLDRARARTARTATAPSRRTWTCSSACGGRVPRRRAHAARQDRHGLAQPEHARPGHVPHPARARTTAPATRGASTRCTTARTACRTPSRASPTRSARWSSRTTGRSTTGSSTQLGVYHPQQIEFARLNLTYTVMSKRKLLQLVEDGHVRGWDDPRMPTLAGLRRRGYTPEAIRDFCERIGVAKTDSMVDVRAARALRPRGPEQARRRASWRVLRPLQGGIDELPRGPGRGAGGGQQPRGPRRRHAQGAVLARALHRAGRLHGGRRRKKFFRLAPGREVRLRYAYFITCTRRGQGRATGEVVELRCTYDPATRGGDAPDGRKVKATLHWVSAAHALDGRGAPLRPPLHEGGPDDVAEGEDWRANLNPNSLEVLDRLPRRAEPRAAPRRRPRASSSGSATSASTPTRRPARPSSTARSRSGTSGRGCRRRPNRPEGPGRDRCAGAGEGSFGSRRRPHGAQPQRSRPP